MILFKKFNLFAGLALVCVASCQQTKETLGISRHQPDEFRVMTRPTLRTPSSTDLRVPKKGAASPFIKSPVVQAMQALGIMSHTPTSSAIEANILKKADVSKASQTIREQLDKDRVAMPNYQADPWAQKLFYWQKEAAEKGDPLDALQEYKRLHGKEHITHSS